MRKLRMEEHAYNDWLDAIVQASPPGMPRKVTPLQRAGYTALSGRLIDFAAQRSERLHRLSRQATVDKYALHLPNSWHFPLVYPVSHIDEVRTEYGSHLVAVLHHALELNREHHNLVATTAWVGNIAVRGSNEQPFVSLVKYPRAPTPQAALKAAAESAPAYLNLDKLQFIDTEHDAVIDPSPGAYAAMARHALATRGMQTSARQ
jgi:hypothetical protein